MAKPPVPSDDTLAGTENFAQYGGVVDTLIYVLIAISSVLSMLLYTGKLGLVRYILAPLFVVSPFAFAIILLHVSEVITVV